MLAGLSPEQLAIALAAALAAAFVRGLAGFGMAILLVPVLGLAIPPGEAVVVSNWLGVLIGLVGLRKILGNSEKSAYVIGGLAVLFTPLGVWLLAITDPAVARLVIALIALGSFVLVLLPKRAEHHAPGTLETGTTGITSGVLTGFAGEIPTAALMAKQARLQGLIVGSRRQQQDYVAALDRAGIRPGIDRTFGFDELPEAFRHQEAAGHFGKICAAW